MDGRFSIFVRNTEDFESYASGATIFSEGDKGDCLYVVRSGAVELQSDGLKLSVAGEGDVFGEMILTGRPRRSATATAQEDTTLVRVDQNRFDRIVQMNPFIARDFMRLMADRLAAMNERLKVLS